MEEREIRQEEMGYERGEKDEWIVCGFCDGEGYHNGDVDHPCALCLGNGRVRSAY